VASIGIDDYDEPAPIGVVRSVANFVLRFIKLILTLVIAAAVGVWSSDYMVSHGSPLSTDYYGPWQHWRDLGRASRPSVTMNEPSGLGAMVSAVNS
jgi:hypothetical protein